MKKITTILLLLFLFSCGNAPTPGQVFAEKKGLNSPEELNTLSLKVKRKYSHGTEIFNFFLWPSVSREELVDIAAFVAQTGLQVEKAYKKVDEIFFQKSLLEPELEKIEDEYEKELQEFLKKYICFVDSEDADSCSNQVTSIIMIPEECFDLSGPPWDSFDLEEECEEGNEGLEEFYDDKGEELQEKIDALDEQMSEELEIPAIKADLIRDVLENNETDSDKWQNWFQTEGSTVKLDKGMVPEISLKIKFNNVKDGGPNKYLTYNSENDNPDLIKVKRTLKGPIPTLTFTILEKRYLRGGKEERTGTYYKATLSQTEMDNGIEFVGDVEKFDSKGISKAKGMMKIYLRPFN